MQKIVNKIVVFGLIVVMVALFVFSYVSAYTNYDFTVFVFAGAADQETNRQLIEQWADQYAEKHADEIGKDKINVGLSFQSDTNLYFSQVQREIASGKADDVIYVSPKYVKSFALNDAVLDLTDYVNWNDYNPNGIWSDAIGAYAFVEEDGTIGDPVTYVGDPGPEGHGGSFQTADGRTAGVYALPKDFSSFGLAYNRNFFTQTMRDAYTNTVDTHGAIYYVNADGSRGDPASIINIGRTVRYYPFNYFKYESYEAALSAQDPIAEAAESVDGYDVTIMGWPGDTYYTGEADDPATPYDDSIGYVTYTYSEYGAMAWAVGYYANSYDVPTPYSADGTRNVGKARGAHQLMTWLNGFDEEEDKEIAMDVDFVYGNDQYEGSLYLTAWLLGNGVDIISDDYTSVTAPSADADYGINSDKFKEAYAAFLAFGSDWNANSFFSGSGESTLTIGGWGTFNSGRCIFYGIGTWDLATFNSVNRNTLSVGIMPEPVSESYSPYARIKDAHYESKTYGEEPVTTPIEMGSEEWIAYEQDRQDAWAARLDTVGYGVNGDVLERYTGEDAWIVDACADLCAYLTLDPTMQRAMTYSGSQLTSFKDQGISYLYYQGGEPAGVYEDEEIAMEANFDYMITPDGNNANSLQVTVAEIERLAEEDNKETEKDEHEESFQAILASLGLPANASGTVTIGDGSTYKVENGVMPSQLRETSPIWTLATAIATKMYNDHVTAKGTIRDYITTNFPSFAPYVNTYFANEDMGSVVTVAYAYKCLNLVALNFEDRNLQIRMVSGDNGALDSCMYTYNSRWIDEFGSTKGYMLIAYESVRAPGTWDLCLTNGQPNDAVAVDNSNIINPIDIGALNARFFTPSAFCDWIVNRSQALLDLAVAKEESIANQD